MSDRATGQEPKPPFDPPLPGFGRTLVAASLAALVVSLFTGIVVVTRFKDESLDMLLTTALFGTVFGLPYALLVAVVGPRLTRRIRTPLGRFAIWLGAGFICGAGIFAFPSALLGKLVNVELVTLFGGFGMLGSTVLMATLGRR